MGIKNKIQERTLKKMSKKLKQANPMLINLAVKNDDCYEQLAQSMFEVNERRTAEKRYIYEVSGEKTR